MRLKTLEIKGFKSFADRTVIHFDERVTGVVGPNGCGKSNIVDSIRWVIGEHRISQLRSENLEGLVFNGSKNRSASGLAEVSLTFDNTRNVLPTEFSTVTITRKFFKNGESEYRLNDVVCRLKDIHNLFMDTGVTSDSYSIIEANMVEDLIKDKDGSRRRMLEQAAGISVYKTRRKEAALKLEATQADLNRIEDLLFEIGNNLKTLESQAKKAQRYNDIKKEYRDLSIELAKASLEGFNLTYQDLTGQQEAELTRKTALDAGIAQAEAAIERDRLLLIERERELQLTQKQFNELVSVIRSREEEKNLASQQISYMRERENHLLQVLDQAALLLKDLEGQAETTRARHREQEEILQGLSESLQQSRIWSEEAKNKFAGKKLAMESLRGKVQQVQQTQFEAEKKAAVAETSVQNLQEAITRTEEEQSAYQDQFARLADEKQSLDQSLSEKKEMLDQLLRSQAETQDQVLGAQSEIELLRARLVTATRSLDAKKNEYDLLKSMVDNLEGYPESIKFLNRNPDWQVGAPILSEVLFCPDQYRAALESLLEPYLNYYIVRNAQEALQAIRLLGEHQKGKANFFILDQIPSGSEHTASAPEGTLPALQILELDEAYKPLGELLLGNVYIAREGYPMDQASGDAVILEESGRAIRGKYYLQGGSVGMFEGKKIGRGKHLEMLLGHIETLQHEVGEIDSEISRKRREIDGYHDQLKEIQVEECRNALTDLQTRLFGIQNRVDHLRSLLETGADRLGGMRQSLQTNQEEISRTRADLETIRSNLNSSREESERAEALFFLAEKDFNESTERFNEENLLHIRQQSTLLGIAQELEFTSRQITDLQGQIDTNSQQLAQARSGISEAGQKLEAAESSLMDLYRQREGEEQKLNLMDQAYYSFRNEVGESESEIRLKTREREQTEQLLAAIKEKINELKLQLASMKERLHVEFRVVLDEILDQPRSGNLSVEDLQAGAEKFRKRLENMGEINPTSIEAFQEISKRYEFILEQKNDLVSAKESLMKTIEEVEVAANQKFLETFHQVKDNFSRVFKTLFTEEDQCDLILTLPDNIAETNIEIIAQPKGKKPTVINQLSGGEKTMVATALLFAIYLIKPAPFCILDEVDAPLD
ncbi:MAG TPA: chromosome segregation protein SMC, partial [Chitinophagaceae bacterium]|nr:chromosome segregation protein SMC [Chitinophagaceae bacterium]